MDSRRELRKFPRGERCPECGARRYYLESGLRFCSNGHQVEGFIQFDVGDEQDAGRMGNVVRREKEIKEKELRHLTGQAGKNLYLECLQLILRNQILWLVGSKGHREELETVVRDLWDLRTRGSSSLAVDDDDDPQGEMFSSQPEATEPATQSLKNHSKAQSWDPERDQSWPMPRMIDTLALCYLGCLLLRTPTSIGEICNWVNGGHMPYKRAYYDLSQEMQDRLPSPYTKALKLPLRATLQGADLHEAVMELALSYHHNYEMIFPFMNETVTLIYYTRQLALPVEVLITARVIISVLSVTFQLPIEKTRLFVLDYPEILLVAILIVATKLCYPLGPHPSLLKDLGSEQGFTFNWRKWQAAMAELDDPSKASDGPSLEKVTADQVTSMAPQQLDKYFAHVASLVSKNNENPITRFFPSEDAPPLVPPREETAESEVDIRARNILERVLEFRVPDGEESGSEGQMLSKPKPAYEAYRSVEDLTEHAKALYVRAGEVAGLSLQEVVRAVYMFEQRILTWQREKKQTEEAEHSYMIPK